MQATDAGILIDQMQLSHRFMAAMKVVKDTSCDVKVQKASEKLEDYLSILVGLSRRVVSLHTLMWSHNRVKECVPLRKFKIGFLIKQILHFFTKQVNSRDHVASKQPKNPLIVRSENEFCVSLLGRLIQIHSDHTCIVHQKN